MIAKLLSKVFGSRNERLVKRMHGTVQEINALEPAIAKLSDAELRAKTVVFRLRVSVGAFVVCLLSVVFVVARVVAVNDYLARRDARWMGRLYEFLGMTTGVIVSGQSSEEKRIAYACDITYGTNYEYGFDYLRDNMAFSVADRVQRGTHFAIVDEVDSILIDEARTPLIISGPTDDNSDLYIKINALIPALTRLAEEGQPGDYSVDEKARQVYLTEEGHQHVEDLLLEAGLRAEGASLYDATNISLMHHLNAALRAHALLRRDVEYIVKDKQIVIVDEFTGRTLPGRRWSEGLHQAVEAKEGVPIQNENQTLASITFQIYFRLYE